MYICSSSLNSNYQLIKLNMHKKKIGLFLFINFSIYLIIRTWLIMVILIVKSINSSIVNLSILFQKIVNNHFV